MNSTVRALQTFAHAAARAAASLLLVATFSAWASVTVTLTAPTSGTVYTHPSNVPLAASASAGGGYTVSKVEFFYGTTLIGTDFTAPYSMTWTGAPAGQHSLTAKATAIKKNSPDQTATSSVVNVTMNARPWVEIIEPARYGNLPIASPTLTVSAAASDSDGTIAKVDFYECDLGLIGTVTQAPYSFQWTPPQPYITATNKYRSFQIRAEATDNHGAVGLGAGLCHSFLMTPAAEITSPAGGASYAAPATIPLEVTVAPVATTSVTGITVQFYHGETLIGEKFGTPFTFNWENVPQGSYAIRAKMLHLGYEWWSDPINVTVNAQAAQLYFVHTDHLNTPRLVADATGTTVWRWDQAEPFGNNPADEDPDANSVAFDLPLRLPGQRYDKETNLAYNYFRDYDPGIGRYVESDPIGLSGGLNTYIYGDGMPIVLADPYGLQASSCAPQNSCKPACEQSYFDCLANCIRANDPTVTLFGDSSTAVKGGMTALGGTFPKSLAGLPKGLGGASPVTTVPSAATHAVGGGASGTVGGIVRSVGRFCSPIWIGYGLGMATVEVICATGCAQDSCLY